MQVPLSSQVDSLGLPDMTVSRFLTEPQDISTAAQRQTVVIFQQSKTNRDEFTICTKSMAIYWDQRGIERGMLQFTHRQNVQSTEVIVAAMLVLTVLHRSPRRHLSLSADLQIGIT